MDECWLTSNAVVVIFLFSPSSFIRRGIVPVDLGLVRFDEHYVLEYLKYGIRRVVGNIVHINFFVPCYCLFSTSISTTLNIWRLGVVVGREKEGDIFFPSLESRIHNGVKKDVLHVLDEGGLP